MGASLDLDAHFPLHPAACVAHGNARVRGELAQALRHMGYRVHEASTAELAFFVASQVKLGLMVTDVALPDMSGVGMIRRIHRIAPKARIVALSDGDLPIYLELAYRAGAHATLSAPFSAAALCAAVHEACDSPDDDGWHVPTAPHPLQAASS